MKFWERRVSLLFGRIALALEPEWEVFNLVLSPPAAYKSWLRMWRGCPAAGDPRRVDIRSGPAGSGRNDAVDELYCCVYYTTRMAARAHAAAERAVTQRTRADT